MTRPGPINPLVTMTTILIGKLDEVVTLVLLPGNQVTGTVRDVQDEVVIVHHRAGNHSYIPIDCIVTLVEKSL